MVVVIDADGELDVVAGEEETEPLLLEPGLEPGLPLPLTVVTVVTELDGDVVAGEETEPLPPLTVVTVGMVLDDAPVERETVSVPVCV